MIIDQDEIAKSQLDVAPDLEDVRAVVVGQVERPRLAAVADHHRHSAHHLDDDRDVLGGWPSTVEHAVAGQGVRGEPDRHPVVEHGACVAGGPAGPVDNVA